QRVGDQLVVSTARLVVWSTRWAVRARVPGEVQTLALVAPPPVVLSRSRRPILDEIIVSTACVVVRSARGAHRAGVAGKIDPLALMAPPPVVLADREVRHNACELRAIGRGLRAHAELGECTPDILPRPIPLAAVEAAGGQHMGQRQQNGVASVEEA